MNTSIGFIDLSEKGLHKVAIYIVLRYAVSFRMKIKFAPDEIGTYRNRMAGDPEPLRGFNFIATNHQIKLRSEDTLQDLRKVSSFFVVVKHELKVVEE